MPTTVKDILRRLYEDGWLLVATKGSHRQFRHAIKKGRVTVPGYGDTALNTYFLISSHSAAPLRSSFRARNGATP